MTNSKQYSFGSQPFSFCFISDQAARTSAIIAGEWHWYACSQNVHNPTRTKAVEKIYFRQE
jgi:hypothetical protein